MNAAVRTLLFLSLLCTCGSAQAQRGQIVPPFLQETTAPATIEMEGETYVLPDFSITPAFGGGGGELISQTPLGYLATRRTNTGLRLELRRVRDVFRSSEYFRSTPNPLLVTEGLGRTPNGPVFDFTQSAPHLAFFCRLEINEKAGFVIPAKFRLGAHRYWQDDLLRGN
ncbi:hypothetical protein [Neolewinella agarilytica]|uniref:hypothetical protein n=1 Tax=Neolewinella agarilytica TaxID=478744 RepID=UPI0023568465|nr:hypothetical protein [Neolewinella agarilytica]